MQTKYLYSCVNQSKVAQIENELRKQFPQTKFEVKDNINSVRTIIEIEHLPEEGEGIEVLLAKYEDNWTEIEIDAWLEKRNNVEENAISLVTLMKSSMYSELDYVRMQMFEERIPATIVEQRNFYDFNSTTYQLQIGRKYLADALALLRRESENSAEENEEQEDIEEADNQGNKLASANEEIEEESPFEPLLKEVKRDIEKKSMSNLVIKLLLASLLVIALVARYYYQYSSNS